MAQEATKKDPAPTLEAKALHAQVVDQGACAGCGACVAVCQVLASKILEFNAQPDNRPIRVSEEDCTECGLCYSVCPKLDFPAGSRMGLEEGETYVGDYRRFELLRATDPAIQERAQDGGVVTGLLKYLMETRQLDGAVVSTVGSDWKPEPAVVTRVEDLLDSMGTRYSVSPNLLALETLHATTLDHRYPGYNDQKFAFVGTPCMVTALQNMRALHLDIARKFSLVIGLFCYENFNYDEIINRLETKTGTKMADWEKLNIKGKMLVHLKDKDEPVALPLKEFHDIVRGSCNACLDLTNFDADIAVGGIGAPKGFNSVLIRTKTGEEAIQLALGGGALGELPSIGEERQAAYAKALKSINFVAKRKITTNRQRQQGE